jgi:hypothetical protein
MSATLNVWASAGARIDGRAFPLGDHNVPTAITVTGNVHERRDTIANAANAVVYSDELGDFVFGWLESDMTTRVVLTDTESNSFSLPLLGTGESGKMGLPLLLGGDDTVNTATTINSIQVFNVSGSSAKVRCVIVE